MLKNSLAESGIMDVVHKIRNLEFNSIREITRDTSNKSGNLLYNNLEQKIQNKKNDPDFFIKIDNKSEHKKYSWNEIKNSTQQEINQESFR